MALTAKDLFDLASTMGAAQTHGFVPSPGHAVGDALIRAPLPVAGGNAPALAPDINAAMPVQGAGQPTSPPDAPPVDPGNVPMFPGVHPDLHNKLVEHFSQQAADAQRNAEAARAFMGPGGAIGQLGLDSLGKIKNAGDITEAAEQKRAGAEGELATQEADDLAKQQRQDEQRARIRDKTINDYQTRANVLSDQAQNAEVRDFWADKSTGSRILGIIAQTLSGAANGLAGNPGAPSPLDRIINRDLEVQQANLQNKRLSADRAQNALGAVYRGFEQQDASIAAYRQAASKWYAAKANQLAAQFQSDTASARNQMIQAKAQQDEAASQTAIAKAAADSADRLHLAADDNLNQLARDDANLEALDRARQNDLVRVPGVSVPVPKRLSDAAWRKQAEGFGGALAQLDNIEKQVSKPGFSIKALAQSEAGKSLLEGDVRQLLGTGANLSKYEEKSLKALSADYLRAKGVNSLSELSTVDYRDYIRAMRTSIARTLQGRIRSRFPGADLSADPGFETARKALDEDDAE